jgi:ATP-dependent DNA helicase 2 subunit 1
MLNKGLVSLAKFVKNKASEPRLCIIVPQGEEVDSMNQQINAPGFNLIFLPYLDDIRPSPLDIPTSIESRVSTTMDSAAKNIINQLHFPSEYSYKDNISSIAIQKFYSCLQAVALETVVADVDQPKDMLVSSKQLLKEDVDVFNSILSITTEKVKKPRAPPKAKGEPATKKAKK